MSSKHLRALAVATAAAALVLSTATTASAAPKVTRIELGDGDTLRVRFYDGLNFSGDVLEIYGSNACTTTTSDLEVRFDDLARIGWANRIESIRDYNKCDVNAFTGTGRGGSATGFVDYGSAGKNLSATFRNRVRSVVIS